MNQSLTRIYLLRHGETANAATGCYNGQNDIALSDFGVEQIKNVALSLKDEPVKAVYSSDLQRAFAGAKIISEHFSLSPVAYREFREINYGRWEGLTFKEIAEKFPEESMARYKDIINFRNEGGGENIFDLKARVMPLWDEIILKHAGETIVVMAHAGVTRLILCEVLGLDLKNVFKLRQDFAAVNILNYYQDKNTCEVALLNG